MARAGATGGAAERRAYFRDERVARTRVRRAGSVVGIGTPSARAARYRPTGLAFQCAAVGPTHHEGGHSSQTNRVDRAWMCVAAVLRLAAAGPRVGAGSACAVDNRFTVTLDRSRAPAQPRNVNGATGSQRPLIPRRVPRTSPTAARRAARRSRLPTCESAPDRVEDASARRSAHLPSLEDDRMILWMTRSSGEAKRTGIPAITTVTARWIASAAVRRGSGRLGRR